MDRGEGEEEAPWITHYIPGVLTTLPTTPHDKKA
jgi:hypothetical protein